MFYFFYSLGVDFYSGICYPCINKFNMLELERVPHICKRNKYR
nr:MAG TPA: hypothetical protein [Bacteriophage sp.]